jgi:hypothetical protein
MTDKTAKAPAKKETPLEAADRLLTVIEKSQSDIKTLFDSAHSGLQDESTNAFLQYEKQFRNILKIPSQEEGGSVISRLSEFTNKLNDLYQDWGAEKDLRDIDDPQEKGRLAGLYLFNFRRHCKTIGVLKSSYDALNALLENPTMGMQEKQLLLKKATALLEKYRRQSANIKSTNHAIFETWEDIFQIICTTAETNIKISEWRTSGGEGKSPWIIVGWWTDAQGRHRPRSVRACDDNTE